MELWLAVESGIPYTGTHPVDCKPQTQVWFCSMTVKLSSDFVATVVYKTSVDIPLFVRNTRSYLPRFSLSQEETCYICYSSFGSVFNHVVSDQRSVSSEVIFLLFKSRNMQLVSECKILNIKIKVPFLAFTGRVKYFKKKYKIKDTLQNILGVRTVRFLEKQLKLLKYF